MRVRSTQLGLLNVSALSDDRGATELSATLASKPGEGYLVALGRWKRVRGFWTTPENQRPPFPPTLDLRATSSTGLGSKIELRPWVGNAHVLRVGADWRFTDGHTQDDLYRQGRISGQRRAAGTTSDLGLFFEENWTLGALVFTIGARADRAGWDGSFCGGAVFTLTNARSLRGSDYTGLRQPTLNELLRSFTVFPVVTRADAALENEQLRGFEGGFDWRPARGLSFTVTAFDNKVRGAIANVTVAPNLCERQNVDAIHARGLELGADAKLGNLSFMGTFAYTDAEVAAPGSALDGNRPAQTPRARSGPGCAGRSAKVCRCGRNTL